MALKDVSVSQGMMLETLSGRLLTKGMAHFGAPDKKPAVRLATLEAAGAARVPFTTGILIGIGETFEERVDALLAIRAHERHGHIQEVIVQNFRAKQGTPMAVSRFTEESTTSRSRGSKWESRDRSSRCRRARTIWVER
jgi:FO synthase